MKLVVATTSKHKLSELLALGRAHGIELELVGRDAFPGAPDVEENGETFADNARLKAVALARFTGLPALADDSGLCVDALGGAPGVRSARYAPGSDADRVQALLQALQGVPAERRGAHFACALCLALPDGATVEVEGRAPGHIISAPRGQNGFGYDPVFEVETGQTFAELASEQKNERSHRARAFALMAPHLRELATAQA